MNESRNWIWPIVVGAVVCSAVTALVTTSVGHIEFHQAKWTHTPRSLPAIAEAFRAVYFAGLLLPIASVVLGFFVWAKKLTNAVTIACWVSALAVAHVSWFLFSFLALYLANQSFVVGN
jgi:hypothetical protein